MYKYSHDTSSENRTVIRSFGGLNENGTASAGEFCSVREFSSNNYPALKTRNNRRKSGTFQGGAPTVFVGDGPRWLTRDGTLYNGREETAGFAASLAQGEERSAVMLGSVAVIFPDKKWTNTASGASGDIEFNRAFPQAGNSLKLTLEFDDGTVPDAYYYKTSEPVSPANGQLWCSKQPDGSVLAQRYFSMDDLWLPQEKIRYRFTSPGIGEGLAEGDYVTVALLSAEGKRFGRMEKEYRVTSVTEDSVSVDDVPEIWLVAHVCRSDVHEYTIGSMRLARTVPDLMHVCSCGNRLWGCTADGHEIHSTALGSISSWERFEGSETDSWAATIGSPGEFTGCAVWDGNPVFFKENELIRVFGNKPSNFGTVSVSCVGIERGSRFSPACVRGVLYYKGADGFYMWDGGISEKISRGISEEYRNVYGAALGDKYYAAVTDKNGVRSMLIYDTARKTWNTSSLAAVSLCTVGCELYAVCEGDKAGDWYFVSVDRLGAGNTLDGVVFNEEYAFEWNATTGNLLGFDDESSVREVNIGCLLEKGAALNVYAVIDSQKRPVLLGHISGTGNRADVTLTVPPNRCRSFALQFCGKGTFTLYSVSLTKRG